MYTYVFNAGFNRKQITALSNDTQIHQMYCCVKASIQQLMLSADDSTNSKQE